MKNIVIPAFWRGAYKAGEEETQSLLWDAYGALSDTLRGLIGEANEQLMAWGCEPEMDDRTATVVHWLGHLAGAVRAAAMSADEVVKCLGHEEYYERATGCPLNGGELVRARRVMRAQGCILRDALQGVPQRSELTLHARPACVEVAL
jgi:hypothetical protein